MSFSPAHLNRETDRTPTRSSSATMSITPSRSSKEWSASALARDREAKAEAARQQDLQAQLAAIQAQLKEAEEKERRIHEQAAIDRQNAKEQKFFEITLTQQERFRSMLDDNTFTRVAQTFRADGDLKYVKEIEASRPGFENSIEFKSTLWEAVAGNDPAFLQQAAQKIACCYQRLISDEDILAVQNSVSCLSPDFVSLTQPRTDIYSEENEQTVTKESRTESTNAVESLLLPGPQNAESVTPFHQLEIYEEPQSHTTVESTLASTEQDTDAIKLEVLERGPDKRNLMDVIEQDTMTAVRSASVADSDTNIQLTDPLGNIITGEDYEAEVNTNLTERTPIREAAPETPTSTNRKHHLEDEGTPTPSEIEGTSTSKKRKTTRPKSTGKSPHVKFEDYIESRFKSGDLKQYDLLCSVCGQEARNPRVTHNCHHVYCIGCFTSHKNGAKGKDAHNTICAREDCGSAMGSMSAVKETAIKKLKASFIVDDDIQGIQGNTQADNDQDEEMTDID